MFIDTHCHLEMIAKSIANTEETGVIIQTVKDIVHQAAMEHVSTLITIGIDSSSNAFVARLSSHFSTVYGAIGIHPCDCTSKWQEQINELKQSIDLFAKNKLVAIGEIGLDFYHPGFDKLRQKDVFRAQIEMALFHNLPVIIHSRNAIDETLAVIDEFKKSNLRGVFHCFSESSDYAHEIIKRSFFIGVAGHSTYPKNTSLQAAIKSIGISSLLLETDSPFLPPQKIRGQINTPRQIPTIGNFIATLLALPLETVASTTTKNAQQLFGLP